MDRQCGCGSVHDEVESGFRYNLYEKIDKDRVQCLNEYEEGTGVTVFKTWEERLNRSKVHLREFSFCKSTNNFFHTRFPKVTLFYLILVCRKRYRC